MATEQNTESISTRPYLIRALHEWCCDNGFTPYITVAVDTSVQVPLEYAENGEIVLNIGFDATTALRMSNDYIEFKARFSGAVRDIMVPMDNVIAIFSRESGQGMAFPRPDVSARKSPAAKETPRVVVSLAKPAPALDRLGADLGSRNAGDRENAPETGPAGSPRKKPKPSLTRIK